MEQSATVAAATKRALLAVIVQGDDDDLPRTCQVKGGKVMMTMMI